MSKANVEVVRRWTEAFNAHDIGKVLSYCDPDVEFHSTFAAVGGADYHGHPGVRKWHQDLEETWGEIRSELETIYDLGEHVLTFTVLRGAVTYRVRGIQQWRPIRFPEPL
jgi:ketosteroid isomerase-like protein